MKVATVYGYAGAERWRYVVEYRAKRLGEMRGDRGRDNAVATLEAWLVINGFTHYRYGPQGLRRTVCTNWK